MKTAKDFKIVYKFFLAGRKIKNSNGRIYYQKDKERWTWVEQEDAFRIHTKNKEFLIASIIKGAQP